MIAGQPLVVDGSPMVVVDTNGRGDVDTLRPVGQPDAPAVAFTGDHDDLLEVECSWFALCDHTATALEPHPILGDVPICERCHAKNESLRA